MRLLIVEDAAVIARDLARMAEAFGHAVVGVSDSGEGALALASVHRPDLVLIDISLKGSMDGIVAAQQLQDQQPLKVIYLTAHADAETVRRAAATRPVGYLLKPFDERSLWSLLELAGHLRASEARFAATLHSIGDAVLVTDLQGRVTFANAVAAQLIGREQERLVGRPLDVALLLVDAATRQPVPSLVARALEAEAPVQLTAPTLLLADDGRVWPIEDTAAPIRDTTGAMTGVVVVFREVSARRALEAAKDEAEAALRASNAQLALALAAQERRTAELGVLSALDRALARCASLADGYGIVAHAAQRLFPETTGVLYVPHPPGPALERAIAWGPPPHLPPSLDPAACRVLREERVFLGSEVCGGCHVEAPAPSQAPDVLCVPLRVADASLGVLHMRHLALAPSAGAFQQQLVLSFAEQAALGLANVQLRVVLSEQAIRDPLTGLFNRRYLEETLLRELHRAMRDRYPVGVIMLDVDHFKQVNDTYGHEAGDTVLRALGTLLLGMVRAGDVVCRYGGEEFVLMLPKAPLAVVFDRAEAIRQAVSSLAITHNELALPRITVSLGASVVLDAQASVAQGLACADAALYAAKRAGRNRVVAQEPEITPAS